FVVMGKDAPQETASTSVAATQTDASAPAPVTDDAPVAPEGQQQPAGEYNGQSVRPGNPVVAKVDGQDITRVDVYNFIQLMPPQIQQLPAAQVYPMALEQVINTRLIQNKAEAANLEAT